MNNRLKAIVLVLMGTAACSAPINLEQTNLPTLTLNTEQTNLPTLTLENAAGEKVTIDFPRERPLVIMIPNKEAKVHAVAWVERIHSEFLDTVEIRAVVILDSVPSLMRDVVGRKLAKDAKPGLLLDWEGILKKHFTPTPGKPFIAIVARDGTVAKVVNRTLNDQRWKEVQAILADAASSTPIDESASAPTLP